jgi:DNA-binding Xre family transcriptional regulator
MKKTAKKSYKLHLDEILQEKGISKYKLSQETGISEKTLYQIQKRDPELSTLISICNYLKIGICQLITIEN